ncbi:hypothetical protein GQ44DRAFT_771576 [Phaeosphaeriaceae sp. PMI808]|nr:hypothetical protein GQ44DRAFT_771576 [Phaeosphaeriaceae sp. PMI808]
MASLAGVFNHLVLPRQIPGKQDTDIDGINQDILARLIHATTTLRKLDTEDQTPIWLVICRSLQRCQSLHHLGRLDKQSLLLEFRSLSPGEPLFLHVAEQNAALIIRRDVNREVGIVIFEAFETSPSSADVLASQGALLWDFPDCAAQMDLYEFEKPLFQEALADFLEKGSMEPLRRFQAHIMKAKTSVVEARDTSSPALVTQLLIPLIEAIGSKVDKDFSGFKKRVRDDVNLVAAEFPWRRLPFWLVLRVCVQRQLQIPLGCEAGRAYYKFLIVTLLVEFLNECPGQLAPELTLTLRSKICRRLAKLEQQKSTSLAVYRFLFATFGNFLAEGITRATNSVETAWEAFKRATTRPISLLPTRVTQESHYLTLPNSGAYIQRILNLPRSQGKVAQSLHLPPLCDSTIEQVEHFTDLYFRLAELENKIDTAHTPHLSTESTPQSRCTELSESILDLFKATGSAYDADPAQISIFILSVFTLWVQLDRCATERYPLLREYRPVFSPELLDALHLPNASEMQRLFDIQNYLRGRNEECKSQETILSEPGKSSFVVEYVARSTQMRGLRDRIYEASEKSRRKKVNELERWCKEFDERSESISGGTCVCEFNRDGSRNVRGCKKCWHWRIRNRMEISAHEDFLPKDAVKTAAIIFELGIPSDISAYRNATWKIFQLAYPSKVTSLAPPVKFLDDYSPLQAYRGGTSTGITIASTLKSFLGTHYKVAKTKMKASRSDVIYPNGLAFSLIDRASNEWIKDFTKPLTFQHLCGIHVPAGLRDSVMPASSHPPTEVPGPTSNETIASETRCPQTMSVQEYTAYQRLLSGVARRWLTMLVELGSSDVNFSSESTMKTFNDLATQAGSAIYEHGNLRDAHVVFEDASFCNRLLRLIMERLNTIISNWREVCCMEILITLILRLYELSSSRSSALSLLKEVRNATLGWFTQLRADVRSATDAYTAERAAEYALKAALLCRRTFNTFAGSEENLSQEDLSIFVQASLAVQENLLVDLAKLSPTLKSMLIRDTKMVYKMKSQIIRSIWDSPQSIGMGINASWSSNAKLFAKWEPVSSQNDRWIVTTMTSSTGFFVNTQIVHYNFIEGHLLVDGKPMGRLPRNIRESDEVMMLFGGEHLLTLPSAEYGMSHVLVTPKDGHEIHFGMRDGKVIIRALSLAGLLEFIPEESFVGPNNVVDIPYGLIHDCRHWLNLDTLCIEVRRKDTQWRRKPNDWIIDIGERKAHRNNRTLLVDPNCSIAKQITGIFRHFEDPRKITIFQPINTKGKLSVEIRHLELSFFVNRKGLLQCRELREEIDPNQDAGTLYGFESKIVLRDVANNSRRSIIAPWGELSITRHGMHVAVRAVNETEYARFGIDDVLGRLSCLPEPRLLYAKAQFHASTSFIIPDPLTGRTGTEEAVHILQSGCSQPWMPLYSLATNILNYISGLSPVRDYYPKNKKDLHNVAWNPNMTTTIQDDVLENLVQVILAKSEQLRVFSGQDRDDKEACNMTPTHLRQRGIAQSRLYHRIGIEPLHDTNNDQTYRSRGQQDRSTQAIKVFQIVKLLRTQPFSISTTPQLSIILQDWPIIGGFHSSTTAISANLSDLTERNIGEQWGDIVNACRSSNSKEPYSLMFRLSLMSLGPKTDIDIIRILAAFVVLPELKILEPPTSPSFNQFCPNELPTAQSLFRVISVDLPKMPTKRVDVAQENYYKSCETDGKRLAQHFLDQWPNKDANLNRFVSDTIDEGLALEKILPEWRRLHQNLQLSDYVAQVENILAQYRGPSSKEVPNGWQPTRNSVYTPARCCAVPIIARDLLVKSCTLGPDSSLRIQQSLSTEFASFPESQSNTMTRLKGTLELRKILSSFTSSTNPLRQHYGFDLAASLDALERDSAQVVPNHSVPNMTSVVRKIQELRLMQADCSLKFLGRLWPCNSPIELLEHLRSGSSHTFGRGTKEAIVSYGLITTQLQRLLRIQNTLHHGKRTRLQEELSNDGHENWNPLDYPDWLLLEIDSDIMIRKDQIEVARAIIAPESNENTVLQLNMGKGKTSCIVPMAMAVLGDKEQLARLIVPKSLLRPTAQMIQSRLGGLVGREISHIPFSRRTRLHSGVLELYQTLHEDMLHSRGVILSAPEHILSYKLSGLQHLASGDLRTARKMTKYQSRLNLVCRDVLDESDVSLAVKTQLIYPNGQLTTVDGHPHRWQIVQSLLSLLRDHLPELRRLYPRGVEVIERGKGFPMIHILQSNVEEALHQRIVGEICAGRTSFLRFADSNSINHNADVFKVLEDTQLDKKILKRSAALFVNKDIASKILLLVRGLLRNRILLLCLKKRWNVQYGLHPGRDPIAVPFEAKGIPSEQAEFGHPDAAIIFTCLAFYLTGVNQVQFSEALRHVLSSPDPASEYDRWTSSCDDLPETLYHWNAINVDDQSQVESLWKYLRTSKSVLDHYMNHFVFPIHGKQFAIKLQASGWDLPLFSRFENPETSTRKAKTTGFSGTNDNKAMLPLTIKQDDLPSLHQTNAEVLTYLLQGRNREYCVAAQGSKRLSEVDFLKQLEKKRIRVLIDAGAFILEMSNEALVTAWLAIDKEPQAAVYFANDNRAWVRYRHGSKASVPLLATPLADSLENCLVYLDEAHTRGIDLKLPQEARGALTLALGQTKDHTVQAAMRLRQLATTQSLSFFAFPETHQSILDVCEMNYNDQIDSSHVVRWLLEQTCRANEQLQSLYISQGTDFCNRTSAAWENDAFLTDVTHRKAYIDVLQHPEQQTLEELYGGFVDNSRSHTPTSSETPFPQILNFVDELQNLRRANDDNSNAMHSSALEEVEQEREVEFQVEEVREVQRPVHYKARRFKEIHPVISEFVRSGVLSGEEGYEHVSSAVSRTLIGQKFNPISGKSQLFLSAEFMKTIKGGTHGIMDNFLRPVEWVLYCATTSTALVLVAEEAELLIFTLRAQKRPALVHLLVYSVPVTKKMLHFSALTYYSLPELPKGHVIPLWLRTELGMFAGQLYMTFEEFNSLKEYINHDSSGKYPDLFAAKTSNFFIEWLALRRKGQDVLHTPIGYLCQGHPLDSGHAFFTTQQFGTGSSTKLAAEGHVARSFAITEDHDGSDEEELDNGSEDELV